MEELYILEPRKQPFRASEIAQFLKAGLVTKQQISLFLPVGGREYECGEVGGAGSGAGFDLLHCDLRLYCTRTHFSH